MAYMEDFGCAAPEWRELHVIAIPDPVGARTPHKTGVEGIYSAIVRHGKCADPGDQASAVLDKFHDSVSQSPGSSTLWVFDPSSWLVLNKGAAKSGSMSGDVKEFRQVATESPLHVYAVRMELVTQSATKTIGDIVVVARNTVQARKRARNITWSCVAAEGYTRTYPRYTATRLA